MNINYLDQPAFPPQVAQDNLGRIIAPIPGMTKLEFAAIILLPIYIQLNEKHGQLVSNGQKITPIDAAILKAQQLIFQLNDKQDETQSIQLADWSGNPVLDCLRFGPNLLRPGSQVLTKRGRIFRPFFLCQTKETTILSSC